MGFLSPQARGIQAAGTTPEPEIEGPEPELTTETTEEIKRQEARKRRQRRGRSRQVITGELVPEFTGKTKLG